ncbi:PIG-L family deacetylase [Rothia sp. 88186D007BW]
MELDAQPHYPVAGELITSSATFSLIPEGLQPKDATVLFVHAHPDDESTSTGATIGALIDAGATVHLLTMTRGEMGEVIDPSLRHLEAAHPANADRGHALGEYRDGELAAALKALGVRHHLYLGEGSSYLPGERTSYRDSGMAWGADGRAIANPSAADDCLTRLPLKPQADAIASAIRDTRPDVVVTYDADGGYGHPDHKRTYEATYAAVRSLEGTPFAPIALWGIEGDPNPQDTRQQAVIMGNIERKREAMRAHATQITITSDTTFEYSNKVPQPINSTETYRLLWGTAQAGTPADALPEDNVEAPGPINSAITAIALGIIAGFAGTMYHAHIWYPTSALWIPWGAALGLLTVYFAATWAAIHTEKNWTAALVGATAFALIGVFAFTKGSSMLVYINPSNPIGTAGTIWALGSLLACVFGMVSASRYRRKKR